MASISGEEKSLQLRDIVRQTSSSLIKYIDDDYTYRAYSRGISFEVSLTTVFSALELPLVEKSFFPLKPDTEDSKAIYNYIAFTLTGGKLKK